MALNVQILSRETIKPYSPTPKEKRIYKYSLLDQLSPLVDLDAVLFYPNAHKLLSSKQIHDKLKLSLSKALIRYYPLAGRANDALSITCNDQGVIYIEAQVLCHDISQVMRNPVAPNNLSQLVPEEQLANLLLKDRALFSVQVNTFACGGLAIGVRISHTIADTSALVSFLNHWAGISRDPTDNILGDHGKGYVVDCTSLFPPKNISGFRFSDFISLEKARNHRIVKRFVFDGSHISRLRQNYRGGRFLEHRPTRFEALASLIWAAIINVLKGKNPPERTSDKPHIAACPVNLRKRIDPPLPERSLGSNIQITMAEWSMNKAVDLDELVGKLSGSIRYLNDPRAVMDLHSGDNYYNKFVGYMENISKDTNLAIVISSWCRFPVYETDYGWGKPDLVGLPFLLYVTNFAVLVDALDGEGIEVWMGLPKDDMARFEQDPGILEYASFIPSSTAEE